MTYREFFMSLVVLALCVSIYTFMVVWEHTHPVNPAAFGEVIK